ncbi:MAG: cytochrome C [Methylobacterium sp.]|nr:MAG: cytochrome C [Methylobacterium sp.]
MKWTIAALAGCSAAIATMFVAAAQDWQAAPPSAPEARLNNRSAAFLATVERRPDRELYARGRLIAMGGGGQGATGSTCFVCHGPNGGGDSTGAFPRLAELPGWYMYKQLGDYAEGTRPNAIMTPIAKALTAEEREAVSVYFALSGAPGRNQMPQPPADPRRLQWGAALVAVGSAERAIPACVNCHGSGSEGIPPSVPGLAGQNPTYIATQLTLWKTGMRKNDPMNVMGAIAVKMTDEDIQAVADYLGRLPWSSPVSEGVPPTGVPRAQVR